jgi:hypothetical protein
MTSLGALTVSSYDVPASVPQPGALSDPLDSLDARLTQAVGHKDPDAGGAEAVWTQHTVDSASGRSVDRWYEILPGSMTVRQQGTISNTSHFVFNGAISPADNGRDAGIQYNVGSGTLLAEIRAQTRKGADPLSTMNGEITLASSAARDQDFSCPTSDPLATSCRWGDYAGASPDPAAADLIWGSNQTNGPIPLGPDDPAWRTQNFSITPNQRPAASIGAAPNPVLVGTPVTLSSAGSSDPDGTVVDHLWDLDGNGSFETDTGAAPTVAHTYGAPGVVNVALRVVDDEGGTADAQTALTVQAPPPPDTTPPRVTLSFKRTQKLLAVLTHGLKGRTLCNEACRTTFQIVLTGKVAKRFHITRTVRIGKKSLALRPGVRTRVTVKISKRAGKKLRSARKVAITLKLIAKDSAGNTTRKSIKITLRR